jgi:hypothetical protein
MTDRPIQEEAIAAIIGSEAFSSIYSQLALSPGWTDPIFGLSDLERVAIWIYTTPQAWYLVINNALRSESAEAEIQVFANLLNTAIRKLPRVQGTVYRGFQLEGERRPFLSRYRRGATVTWLGFTSAARDVRTAYVGEVLFRIESRNRRALQAFSADLSDEEVLFESGTKFRVRDTISHVTGVIAVDLVEL